MFLQKFPTTREELRQEQKFTIHPQKVHGIHLYFLFIDNFYHIRILTQESKTWVLAWAIDLTMKQEL